MRRRLGLFVPFDQYEQRLLRELQKRVARYRQDSGQAPMSVQQIVRGLVRQDCHDILGIEACSLYPEFHEPIHYEKEVTGSTGNFSEIDPGQLSDSEVKSDK